jgi:hypothetical protein
LDTDLKKQEDTVPLNNMDFGAQATQTLSEMESCRQNIHAEILPGCEQLSHKKASSGG